MRKIGSGILFILCFFVQLAWAEPSIHVLISPNPVHEDDTIQLSIEVHLEDVKEIGRASFDAPDFTQVGSASSTSVSSEYVNGKISMVEKVTYTYILQPNKQGELKIGNIGVDVAGNRLHAEDKIVRVLEATGAHPGRQQPLPSDQLPDEESPAAPNHFQSSGADSANSPQRLNSDFTVHVQLNKTSAYVGEPIVAEYWIYDYGGLRSVDVQKWPTFNGFWKEDLQIATRYQFQDAYVKNQRVRRALLGRFAIYAIKPGKLPIDQLVIAGKYVPHNFYNQGDDVFNFFLGSVGQLRTGTHGSENVEVNILPLPEQGRPNNFGGAVGKFRMYLIADKQKAQANSPVNLSLIIEGTGNFQAIDQFKLPLPADFELYESNASVNGSATPGSSRSLENKKTFHYLVLPRKAGKYTIPSLEWSYFDVEAKRYQSLSTTPINLDISPDDGTHQGNTYGGSGSTSILGNRESPAPTAPVKLELRYLKKISDISANEESHHLRNINYILALLVIALSIWIFRPFSLTICSNRTKNSALSTSLRVLFSRVFNKLLNSSALTCRASVNVHTTTHRHNIILFM